MVNKIIEKYKGMAPEIAKEVDTSPEVVTRVLETVESHMLNDKRKPSPPAPPGGISLRAAARKYNLHHTTLIKWIKKGKLPVLLRTPNWLYVDEETISKLKKNGDRGSVTT